MTILAITLSVLAFSFTVATFYWLNWRRGNLQVGPPRSFYASSDTNHLILVLPFLFFNDGPTPILVQNLRIVLPNETPLKPLYFMATVEELENFDGRKRATQFPIRGRDTELLLCEFHRTPGEETFEAGRYPMELQARLGKSDDWKSLCSFQLDVRRPITDQGRSYDNFAREH